MHAGLIPQWTAPQAQALAAETERALRATPREFLARMYGNQPDRWREGLAPEDRGRFTINVLTRLRYCSADGTVNLRLKDAPDAAAPLPGCRGSRMPRASAEVRVVFGHWSTLGLLRERNLLGLDTGCVWGGTLTAVNLDDPEAPPVQVACTRLPATRRGLSIRRGIIAPRIPRETHEYFNAQRLGGRLSEDPRQPEHHAREG